MLVLVRGIVWFPIKIVDHMFLSIIELFRNPPISNSNLTTPSSRVKNTALSICHNNAAAQLAVPSPLSHSHTLSLSLPVILTLSASISLAPPTNAFATAPKQTRARKHRTKMMLRR
uniref:(northern house mosquito) hypothetical protein n=1 Tax=Culex pipiens TaxID=7175 RepID=A0A8D8HYU6_CULPI